MSIDGDALNDLLTEFGVDKIGMEIDQDVVEYIQGEQEEDISHLLGWVIEADTEGYHHNDGDMVDYDVTLISPEGTEFNASNTHCLMTGWNFYGEVQFSS